MKKSVLICLLTALILVTPLYAKSSKKKKSDAEVTRTAPEMAVFSDWKKVRNKKVDKVYGSIRIKVLSGRGTFNIGVVNDNGKTIGVLSNMNEYTSTFFSLKAGKKIYKLVEGGDVKTKARALEDRVQIIYSVNKVADVLVEFIPVESQLGSGYDVLRIQTVVTNTGAKAGDFALKNVMDTVLGEADLYHFYTSEDIPVKNELSFRTMANAQYFNSKNAAAWCQFMLFGADVSPVELVALTNYATAESSSWEPVMTSNKTFDTVASYNNSAVEIIWPVKHLLKEQVMPNVYYIAFAADGNRPKGPEFIADKTEQMKNTGAINALAGKTEKTAVIKTQKIKEVREEVEEPSKDDDVSAFIPKELLTQDYIQSLLDRIESLEAGNPTLNRDELKMLNDELDFILSIMRS